MTVTAQPDIREYRIGIPQQSLGDLRDRLSQVRLAGEIPRHNPESYGVSLAWVRELTEYWRDS